MSKIPNPPALRNDLNRLARFMRESYGQGAGEPDLSETDEALWSDEQAFTFSLALKAQARATGSGRPDSCVNTNVDPLAMLLVSSDR